MFFYKIARGICLGILKIMFRFRVEGKENIPKDKNFIVVSNHTSNLDPPLLGVAAATPLTYMAKEELFKNKLFGALIRKLGAFPISRESGDIGAVKTALRLLRDGHKMVIFPEGGRSKTRGMLRKGKSGAALLAAKTGTGLLPVGIAADFKFRGRVTVKFGEYMDFSDYKGKKLSAEELQKITDEKIMPEIALLAGVKVYENNGRR